MENIKNVADLQQKACRLYNYSNLKVLGELCLIAGIISVFTSIAVWFASSREDRAHGERFGIFVGLWVPSLFILSHRLSRKADTLCCGK
jgi:hypothetical protein